MDERDFNSMNAEKKPNEKIYTKYIELGFEREEIDDKVVHNDTGYYGYILEKKLNCNITIQVCYPELEKPILLVKKANKSDEWHWIYIDFEKVKSFLKAFDL